MNLEPTLSLALTPDQAIEEAARLKKISPFSKPEELLRGSRYQKQVGEQLRADSVTALKGSKVIPVGITVADFAGTIVAEFFYEEETYFVLQTGDLVNWDGSKKESEERILKELKKLVEETSSDNEVKDS